jgi:predicted PurR-regulated permease PerM
MRSLPPFLENDNRFLNITIEAAIRIGLLFWLVMWCFDIARPFLVPIIWGVIIAVAVYPGFRRLERWLAGRRGLAATVSALLMLVVLVVPAVLLGSSLIDGVEQLSSAIDAGTLRVPAPPESVAAWPLVGKPLYAFWSLVASDLGQAAESIAPILRQAGEWLIGVAAGTGVALLQFVIAIIIAGVLLANADGGARATRAVVTRLAPVYGLGFAETAEKIVRSVATGIVGVALLQALLAGIGLLAVGVPAAGLLTIVCVVLGVIQVGVLPVLIPVAIYQFSAASTPTAVTFLIYVIAITLLETVLKPMLLGRGVKLPMVVVFIGAIGGMLSHGIVGLFLGAVVFTLGYGLLLMWLNPEEWPRSPGKDGA